MNLVVYLVEYIWARYYLYQVVYLYDSIQIEGFSLCHDVGSQVLHKVQIKRYYTEAAPRWSDEEVILRPRILQKQEDIRVTNLHSRVACSKQAIVLLPDNSSLM